jgi:uncharacterized membrane protein
MRMIVLVMACVLGSVLSCGWPPEAAAATPEIGSTHSGQVALGAKQVPLPEGRWTVAGRGQNRLAIGSAGAYGAIDSVILVRIAGSRIDAIAEINTNAVPVTDGWGTTALCKSDAALAKLTLYRTRADNLCLFVTRTDIAAPDALQPAAWIAAQPLLRDRGLAHPGAWLTIGMRVSDRREIVDLRFHFDEAAAGLTENALSDADAWALAARTDPARRRHLDAMVIWAAKLAEPLELGLHGRLSATGPPVPLPREVLAGLAGLGAEAVAADRSKLAIATGRGGIRSRAEAVQALSEAGRVTPEQRQAFETALAETPLPPTDEDYFRTLVKKTLSFNFFRVSVDYALAYIVTVSTAVSGYITATIVATHSMVQIANDMLWDRYLAGVQKSGSDVVDFVYLGDRPPAPASGVPA